ncbi:MAG TPA: RNA polymerase sigma factor [Casimicrobiaceae bacterium]|nr:RNA polymerase sigma factor [Casimicrobiaceae bacterium]
MKKIGTVANPEQAAEPRAQDGPSASIAEGGEQALERVMRRHNRMLFRIARSILNDDAEAEDALQDAYLAGFRNIGSFQGAAKMSTWLARIVINEALGRLRKRNRSAVVVPFSGSELGEPSPEENAMADSNAEPPDAAAMRGELRQLLERRIDELPAQFRTVFILRDVEEMTVEETAECLDIPAATVRTRAFRARALLRESLARDIDFATLKAFEFAGERCDRIVAAVLARLRSSESDSGAKPPDAPA